MLQLVAEIKIVKEYGGHMPGKDLEHIYLRRTGGEHAFHSHHAPAQESDIGRNGNIVGFYHIQKLFNQISHVHVYEASGKEFAYNIVYIRV